VSADAYRGATVLVTGGTGYIGSALARRIGPACRRLVILGRRATCDLAFLGADVGAEYVSGDVARQETWDGLLDGVNVVFHLAAFEHAHGSAHDPQRDLSVNALSVLHLLEACRALANPPRIVLASSANVFGAVPRLPVDEDVPERPLTLFGVHKLTAERYVQTYAARGVPGVALRLANVFGPSARPELRQRVVVNRLIGQALASGPLRLFENRACRRDYLYVDDALSAFLAAGVEPGVTDGRAFVVGSGVGRRIEDAVGVVAERVSARTGRPVEVIEDRSVRIDPSERREFVADAGRFAEATGWRAQVSFVDGVDSTIESLLAQRR
jgi:nucleoside-diphosphate-sugar epimerase